MRREIEFTRAFDGVRARCGKVELILGSKEREDNAGFHDPKVGFIVSKKVGNSVVRHRITRQCRHIVRTWIDNEMLRDDEYLVVRALPGVAGSASVVLAHDMECALRKCRRKQEDKGTGEK